MTEIFLDTANIEEIKEILGWGIITGLTTNQKIFLKEKGCNFEETAKEILDLVFPYPVSIEGPNDYEGIIREAKKYRNWNSNIIVKVPMLGNGSGLKAVKTLSEEGIYTNVTACMTVNQAFLAIRAGATYVSLFYNRMKDMKGQEYALKTISETMKLIKDSKTSLIIGSIRSPEDIEDILTVSPSIITIPTKILKQMPFCELTEKTLKEFGEAWEEFCRAEKK